MTIGRIIFGVLAYVVIIGLTFWFGLLCWEVGRFAQSSERDWNQHKQLMKQPGALRRNIRWAITDIKVYDKRLRKSNKKGELS